MYQLYQHSVAISTTSSAAQAKKSPALSIFPSANNPSNLTKDAASTFLSADFRFQEAREFVSRVFNRVLYYRCADPETFLPLSQGMLRGFDNDLFAEVEWVERSAEMLVQQGHRDDAVLLLTFYAHTRAEKALLLGKSLADVLNKCVKLSGRLKMSVGTKINDPGEGVELVNCLVGFNPDKPVDQQSMEGRRGKRRG